VGSGSEYVLKHLNSYDVAIPRGVDIPEGISLVDESLRVASQDIYTVGLDLIVLTEKEILEFGRNIKKSVESAQNKVICRIKDRFS